MLFAQQAIDYQRFGVVVSKDFVERRSQRQSAAGRPPQKQQQHRRRAHAAHVTTRHSVNPLRRRNWTQGTPRPQQWRKNSHT